MRMATAAAGGAGVARRMFSRPRLENAAGRRSVLGHMLFNKL